MERICYIIGAWRGEAGAIRPGPEDLVIAADGGYEALGKLGLSADLVVGDFDSLGYEPAGETVVRHPVRKDDTDMLLAVKLGLERGFKRFVLTGSVGGRLDHTLANLQTLLYLTNRGAKGLLYGEGTAVTVVKNGMLTLTGEGTVSVFCLDGEARGVYERGMSYSLTDAVVTSDVPIGVSNAFTEAPAEITVRDGCLAVLWQVAPEDLPDVIERL